MYGWKPHPQNDEVCSWTVCVCARLFSSFRQGARSLATIPLLLLGLEWFTIGCIECFLVTFHRGACDQNRGACDVS